MTDSIPLFETFPRLASRVSWTPLGDWPTPVISARRFSEVQRLASFYIKREDLSHRQCGGNKLRGLEFLLAEAMRRRASIIVTIGASGSQHLSRTAWHAGKLGLRTLAFALKQPPADHALSNLRIGLTAGATYVPTGYAALVPRLARALLRQRLSKSEGTALFVPPGGNSPLAILGQVNAAMELKRQVDAGILPEPDYLYAAMGSLATVAGLAVGCKLAGLKTRLVGVAVSYRWYCTRGRWARMARRAHRLMRSHDSSIPKVVVDPSELTVVGSALGKGYAKPTDSAMQLARQFYDCEGIQLDGTYSAKALDGAMQFIRQNRLQDRVHLFWHTFHHMLEDQPGQKDTEPLDLERYFCK